MKVSGAENKAFEQPQPDNYPAVCTKIVDLGTQEENFEGDIKNVRKVVLFWELAENMSDGRPYLVNKRYTASIGSKANLAKDITAWRGKPFTAEELAAFELKNVLGKPCLINMVPNKKGDKVVVGSVSKLPKGMTAPEPQMQLSSFDLDNFDQATFDSLTDYWKGLIKLSPEYAKAVMGEKPSTSLGDEEDTIPF